MDRHGYYVNGRRYSLDKRAQALARAEFLASEYQRDIRVYQRDHAGREEVAHVAKFVPTTSTSLLAVL